VKKARCVLLIGWQGEYNVARTEDSQENVAGKGTGVFKREAVIFLIEIGNAGKGGWSRIRRSSQ